MHSITNKFKDNCKLFALLILILALFVVTALLQTKISGEEKEDTLSKPEPIILNTVVSSKKGVESMTPSEETEDSLEPETKQETSQTSSTVKPEVKQEPETSSKPEQPTQESQTSGYNVSYVDKEFDAHLVKVAKEMNIICDISYIYATIYCESTFRNAIESSSGAVGYMQLLPSTQKYIRTFLIKEYPKYTNLSEDLTIPKYNVIYGLYLMKHTANSFGESSVTEQNIHKILTCYNRGVSGGTSYYKNNGTWESAYSSKIVKVAKQIRENGGM